MLWWSVVGAGLMLLGWRFGFVVFETIAIVIGKTAVLFFVVLVGVLARLGIIREVSTTADCAHRPATDSEDAQKNQNSPQKTGV